MNIVKINEVGLKQVIFEYARPQCNDWALILELIQENSDHTINQICRRYDALSKLAEIRFVERADKLLEERIEAVKVVQDYCNVQHKN
jgi:hypothetical protein